MMPRRKRGASPACVCDEADVEVVSEVEIRSESTQAELVMNDFRGIVLNGPFVTGKQAMITGAGLRGTGNPRVTACPRLQTFAIGRDDVFSRRGSKWRTSCWRYASTPMRMAAIALYPRSAGKLGSLRLRTASRKFSMCG